MIVTLSSRSAVIEAFASGTPAALLGMPETSWLDFKSAPYVLSSDHGRFELCKDVAAFANAQGGLLVCRISAKKQGDRALEIAEKLQPFPRRMADVDRYIDVLNELLRPRVTINHYWYRDPGSDGKPDPDAAFYLVIELSPSLKRTGMSSFVAPLTTRPRSQTVWPFLYDTETVPSTCPPRTPTGLSTMDGAAATPLVTR